MDEEYVTTTPPSAELILRQRKENEHLEAVHEAARLRSLTPRMCIREASAAAAALYNFACNTPAGRRDLLELFARPNMARGVGLLLAAAAAALLIIDAALTGP